MASGTAGASGWEGGRQERKQNFFSFSLFFFFVLPLITVFLWGCETRRKQTAISKQKISAPTNSLEKVPCCLPRFQDQTAGWNGWGAMASPACLRVLLAHALVPSPLPSSPSHMVKAPAQRMPISIPLYFCPPGPLSHNEVGIQDTQGRRLTQRSS